VAERVAVTTGAQRMLVLSRAMSECFAVLAIAYCFLASLPFSTKIIVVLVITVLMTSVDRLVDAINYAEANARAENWLDQLTLRFGIEGVLVQIRSGHAPHADWSEATQRAVEDIKSARSGAAMLENSLSIDVILSIAIAPIVLAFRGVVGFGIAWAVSSLSPWFVQTITG
jgi:hypothetical protein